MPGLNWFRNLSNSSQIIIVNILKQANKVFLRQATRGDNDETTLLTKQKIKRILNILIGIAYALIHFPDFLCLNRIGAHSVECFFSSTRTILINDNMFSDFILAFNKIQLQKILIEELGLRHPVKRFSIVAGAHLYVKKFVEFPIEILNLIIISKLLLSKSENSIVYLNL